MKCRLVACLLWLAIGMQAAEKSTVTAVEDFALALIDGFANLAKRSGAIWDDLGTGQASAILDNLASDAANLETEKYDLQQYMLAHKTDVSGETQREVNGRIMHL